MAVSGNASVWADLFPEGLIPDILALILESWRQMRMPQPQEMEDAITNRFAVILRQNKRIRRLFLTIDPQVWLLDDEGTPYARIDLRFMTGPREDVYLAFECKRVNVTYPSGFRTEAREYIDQGMVRFVRRKYSPGLREGGMIGYVMDGHVVSAMTAIEKLFTTCEADLSISPVAFEQSLLGSRHDNARQTRHKPDEVPLRIHHLFLSVEQSEVA